MPNDQHSETALHIQNALAPMTGHALHRSWELCFNDGHSRGDPGAPIATPWIDLTGREQLAWDGLAKKLEQMFLRVAAGLSPDVTPSTSAPAE
jgi:hypothetical protein